MVRLSRGATMFNYTDMGNRMFAARVKKNIKQWEIGKKLGVSQPTYSDIETGKREININQLFIIAEALDVPVTWLLGLDNHDGLTDSEILQLEDFKRYLINKRSR
jgi:transcriptional regulator with XRE-family HTH domain